jgi:RNA polymerase sigma factor (sigma-70 family)
MDLAPRNGTAHAAVPRLLLYHFCRLQLPAVQLSVAAFERHLERCFELFRAKRVREGAVVAWADFLDSLHAVDWFLCCACLERDARAWEALFAARVNRADCLLLDALRARAVRLYPRDEERQDGAVTEFWGYLLAGEKTGATPILARYDGQRPLAPWLIRVFQNWQISGLRRHRDEQALPEDDVGDYDLAQPHQADGQWHDAFCEAAREWFGSLGDSELIILGLRLRYRMSQRDVAKVLGINEGNVSKRTTKLSKALLEFAGERLRQLGWTGEDDELDRFVLTEMESLILDEPRLSADRLAALLAARGKKLPEQPVGT